MKKKKVNIKTIIRQIVREEVAMAIGEVVNELKQPSLSSHQVSEPISEKKTFEKKEYSSNSVLNDVLNETAQSDEWKTLSGKTHTTNDMNDIIGKQYGDMMNGNSNAPVTVDGQTADFLNKDYREVLQAMDEKSKQKRPV